MACWYPASCWVPAIVFCASRNFGDLPEESQLEIVSALTEQILERLKEAIASFSASAPQHDDITMMVLGFKE